MEGASTVWRRVDLDTVERSWTEATYAVRRTTTAKIVGR